MHKNWVTKRAEARKINPEYNHLLPITLKIKYIDDKGNIRYTFISFDENSDVNQSSFDWLIKKTNKENTVPLKGTSDLNV